MNSMVGKRVKKRKRNLRSPEIPNKLPSVPLVKIVFYNVLILIIALFINYGIPYIESVLNGRFIYIISYSIVGILLFFIILFGLKRSSGKKAAELIKHEITKQRLPLQKAVDNILRKRAPSDIILKTGISGLDELLVKGIPRGSSVLVAGGAGSGKTNLCLKLLYKASMRKEKCLYISFEESKFRLRQHMQDFKWDVQELERKGILQIDRLDPFDISRSVEALMAQSRGDLKLSIDDLGQIIPTGFEPDWIVIDSLNALSAAFKEGDDSYRIYIENLFKYLENSGATTFLISETEQIHTKFSKTGVEEFLADGVIVLYHIARGNVRERAIEVLKMRGIPHQERIVAMQIKEGSGVEVYPEQEIFGSSDVFGGKNEK